MDIKQKISKYLKEQKVISNIFGDYNALKISNNFNPTFISKKLKYL